VGSLDRQRSAGREVDEDRSVDGAFGERDASQRKRIDERPRIKRRGPTHRAPPDHGAQARALSRHGIRRPRRCPRAAAGDGIDQTGCTRSLLCHPRRATAFQMRAELVQLRLVPPLRQPLDVPATDRPPGYHEHETESAAAERRADEPVERPPPPADDCQRGADRDRPNDRRAARRRVVAELDRRRPLVVIRSHLGATTADAQPRATDVHGRARSDHHAPHDRVPADSTRRAPGQLNEMHRAGGVDVEQRVMRLDGRVGHGDGRGARSADDVAAGTESLRPPGARPGLADDRDSVAFRLGSQ